MPAGQACVVLDQCGERVTDEAPALVVGHALEGDAEHLGAVAGDRNGEERAENDGVFGFALDADAVRAPVERAVTADDRPHDADREDQAGAISDEGVGAIHVAMQELQVGRQLVVDLEHGGDTEQNQEAEVDHGVHDAGTRFAQQGLHVDAGAEVADATLGVLQGGAAVVGPAALPVLHPVRGDPPAIDDQHGDRGVEGQLHAGRDVAEHLAGDVGRLVELEDERGQIGPEREEGDTDTDDADDVMGLQARTHDVRNLPLSTFPARTRRELDSD